MNSLGRSVHWRDTMSTLGGYHEYIWGCSVPRGNIMSASGDVQYIGVFNINQSFYKLASPHDS